MNLGRVFKQVWGTLQMTLRWKGTPASPAGSMRGQGHAREVCLLAMRDNFHFRSRLV